MTAPSVSVENDGAVLRVATGGADHRFHAIWLRDNALDEATRAAGNGQRLITLGDIPAGTNLSDAMVAGDAVSVTFAPEDKTVSFPLSWLEANSYDRRDGRAAGWLAGDIKTFDSTLSADTVSASFERNFAEPVGAFRLAGPCRPLRVRKTDRRADN